MRTRGLAKVFLLVLLLFIMTAVPTLAAAQVVLSRSVTVNAGESEYFLFENPGKIQVKISSTAPVDVFIVESTKISNPASATVSDVSAKAEYKWTGEQTLNVSASPAQKYKDYYIFIFNEGGSDATLSLSIEDTSPTASNTQIILCCCLPAILLFVILVVAIIIIIMAISKLNKKTDRISKQAEAGRGSPPPQPQGTPQQAAPQQPMAQQPRQPGGAVQAQAGMQTSARMQPPGMPAPAAGGPETWAQQIFKGDTFRVDMKILSLGYSYYIYDAWNRPIAFCYMKPFKFKEDIRVFTDDSKRHEIMTMQQEQILDLSGTFQVWDSMSRQFLGKLKRNWVKSMFKDEWTIMNYNNQEVGKISEDSTAMALLRRFMPFGGFVPNASFIRYQGNEIAVIKEKLRVIGNEYYIHLVPGTEGTLDRRLAVSCVLMMAMFETSKDDRGKAGLFR